MDINVKYYQRLYNRGTKLYFKISEIVDEGKRIMATVDSLLAANEEVLLIATQSRIMPGGSLTTPDSIFVTTRRVIFENPRLFGLKKDMVDFMFKDLANGLIKKGILSSEIHLVQRFNGEKVVLPAVSKGVAQELFSIIRRGISGDFEQQQQQHGQQQMVQEDESTKLLRFAEMRDKGIITEEEFQNVKTKLLGDL